MKYGLDNRDWLPQLPVPSRSSTVWKDIYSVGNISSEFRKFLYDGFKIEVKSGNLTKFWEHKWLGETPLSSQYPRLYAASLQKDTRIVDIGQSSTLGWWSLNFRWDLFDREKASLLQLQHKLAEINLVRDLDDRLLWTKDKSNSFSVGSAYTKWEELNCNEDSNLHRIWKNLSPPKVEVFVWMAAQGKIASRSVLASRGLIFDEGAQECPLCAETCETPRHLLLHCRFSWEVWTGILRWWGVLWICPPTIMDFIAIWFNNSFKNLEKKCWESILFAGLWSIWTARNEVIFSNKHIKRVLRWFQEYVMWGRYSRANCQQVGSHYWLQEWKTPYEVLGPPTWSKPKKDPNMVPCH
ncbi:hypothetical protein RHGRI_003905 [Rhododendron griersonianum]|uniref:Reverse transcriptase zinc-binding domain-containing protein n=1 Tax=Rhododendron griersonianum TaxID=479676 RepID=A0AAV6L6Y5_9ERIC|nr:hypothetical protein RHGRI_003905 [Rhododendron griersonianum]